MCSLGEGVVDTELQISFSSHARSFVSLYHTETADGFSV